MEIRRARTADEVMAAGHLFDRPPDGAATARFRSEHGHHLLIAHVDGAPAGLASGVEVTHPDKGTELFLDAPRRRGPPQPRHRHGSGARARRARPGEPSAMLTFDLAREPGTMTA